MLEAHLRALIKQRALDHEHLRKIGVAVKLLYERDLGGLQGLQAQILGAADASLQLRRELYQVRGQLCTGFAAAHAELKQAGLLTECGDSSHGVVTFCVGIGAEQQ